LESLSFGKPIIGTNYGAIAEIGNGFLIGVDPRDENDIAAKMSQFMNQSETELDLEDCQNYIQKFSWETCAKEVLAIYKETFSV
jgi:glycosyltransferase involved in cell wall biosynthesis